MIEFKDLPEEIQERMLDEQVRQGNPRNAMVFEKDMCSPDVEGGFSWKQSIEGHVFWYKILVNDNTDDFYEKYPKVSNRKMYSEEEVRDLFIKRCRDHSTKHEKFAELLLEQDLKWFEENKK